MLLRCRLMDLGALPSCTAGQRNSYCAGSSTGTDWYVWVCMGAGAALVLAQGRMKNFAAKDPSQPCPMDAESSGGRVGGPRAGNPYEAGVRRA